VNVPCMVKHPDLDVGRYDDQFELLDLYHTVLDHVGTTSGDDAATASGTDADPTALTAEPDAVDFDPARSLLRDAHRTFDESASPESDRDRGEYAFVEYYRPVVELKQLEQKAAGASIDLDEDSRFYSRMRAARRTDAKYVRNERIPDEFYRLDDDPGEEADLAGDAREHATDADEAALEATEAALAAFEDRRGGEWKTVDDDDVLSEMSDDAKDRLQDLGYLE
jgi:hypothetical protein